MVGDEYDIVVVGAGSAGAVVAARLSEDASVTVCLIEAGGPPPPAELMPVAAGILQNDPETDWMFEGDAGGVGKGLTTPGRMMVPRGKMLGGSSGINYMAYVRGHPGDFDAWAEAGADGWAYEDVLPYFTKSEGLEPSDDIVIDPDAHSTTGPLGVSVRSPVMPAAQQFVEAAAAIGIPTGDYNGTDRGGPDGVASLFQTTTRDGKRSSTFHAFLEPVMHRDNLTVVTHAQVECIDVVATGGTTRATGVTYRLRDGATGRARAAREVVVCAGAIGSPQLLLLSGIGPADELEAIGVSPLLDSAHVGKHLKDHLHVPLFYPADGIAMPLAEVAVGLGPDALRAPAGPLPADPAQDADLPPDLAALKAESERQLAKWATEGIGVAASSLYDAAAFFSTGLGDEHTHDGEIGFLCVGPAPEPMEERLRISPDRIFADPDEQIDPSRGVVILLPNPVQPRSEGSVTLASANPTAKPIIDLNYLDDPHDVNVMVAVMRRAHELTQAWPGDGLGDLMVPPHLAEAHGHQEGDDPSDELFEDIARHYALTVYHETSTCRIGDVVDPQLRVSGVEGLRVADASVMPNLVSGNTNAVCVMIGERAAELVARDHGIMLDEFVG